MTTFAIHIKSSLPISAIPKIKKVIDASIGEIKDHAANDTPVLTIEAFKTEWEDHRKKLVSLYKGLKSGELSDLIVYEVYNNEKEQLDVAEFYNRLKFLREIELETEMDVQLETGDIENPEDFESVEEDWLR